MAPKFDISPEKEATMSQFFKRQFFGKTKEISRQDVDLKGKTAIITGSNTGLGLETARQLLDLGLSKLIMAVRSVPKAETARESLLEGRSPGSCDIEIWSLDLSSYQSVTEFAERAKTLQRLDIAILNAALYKIKEEFNPYTGFDEDVQVNYLSNALLMILLLPALQRGSGAAGSPAGRLVLVSSDAACWVKFAERASRPTILGAFKQPTPGWAMQERYGTSKLLGQFFFRELTARVPASAATLDAANPGFCYGSELPREGNGSWAGLAVRLYARLVGKSPGLGARCIVHAAVSFDRGTVHGQYLEDGVVRPMAPLLYKPEGDAIAKQLWEETLSELEFAGVRDIIQRMSN
ncbi:NAD(P)-binding protein [Apiospora rasikravindrae]|uniref:NAD(P)-binding protein n=1 Tax=Apiospora rasikravindrae TaxID=990691 RepID=A0ABR1S1J8_9PEZI